MIVKGDVVISVIRTIVIEFRIGFRVGIRRGPSSRIQLQLSPQLEANKSVLLVQEELLLMNTSLPPQQALSRT